MTRWTWKILDGRIDDLMLEFEGREEDLKRKVQEEMRRKWDLEEEEVQEEARSQDSDDR